MNGAVASPYDALCSFEDVRRVFDGSATLESLRQLNDAVQERLMKDRPLLAMSNADWHAYTALLRAKVVQVEADISL